MCFLDDEELRKEYVLNDSTQVYKGNYRKFYPKQWNVAQVDKFCSYDLFLQVR